MNSVDSTIGRESTREENADALSRHRKCQACTVVEGGRRACSVPPPGSEVRLGRELGKERLR